MAQSLAPADAAISTSQPPTALLVAVHKRDESGIDVREAQPVPESPSLLARFNEMLYAVLFFDVTGGRLQPGDGTDLAHQEPVTIPFVIAVLAISAVFLTVWYGWINIRGFGHALAVVSGRYDNPDDAGDISHFRALTSALSGTVGLGNIAGVAVAIQAGGPGAVFWMVVMAFFGMSAKFSSCTLSQMYRKVHADGSISGGPMYYLDLGLRQKGGLYAAIGKGCAMLFALMIMGGAIGGGNMFQANQTVEVLTHTFGLPEQAKLGLGIGMACLVGVVILGGIRRIAFVTSRLVPMMCGIYLLASACVILVYISRVPDMIALIISMAFTDNALFGGVVGVAIMGIRRAAFSNEAGLGSAAVAHAAAKTDEPTREGLVAMLEPFIDTIVVCMMTALVIIITGVWEPAAVNTQGGNLGVTLTAEAFRQVLPWFPYILACSIALFAYSTMIAWCYYGERGWIYLVDHQGGRGQQTVLIFRLIFVGFVVVGAVNTLDDVLDFSDAMVFSMAFPNLLGSILLAPMVRQEVRAYWHRYRSGGMRVATAS
ncbi:alanine/glycine:cation symporter family protein [Candidatus Entotheonella palauensis]|uniref:alanine/glycine:cation symporter family protein n=1 Tax=Candidatus Entotheonella palauensis TaxID=93172 RepID=UPI0015C423A8|nr:alanine/glycine:cation symporter family protein [Candidatus Entotheonella palauensis]